MLERIEEELRKALEEVEKRKRRLKELEEEEKELLEELKELGGYKGSVVAKYVYCGKCSRCPHGPYYYLVYKEGGKTKWKYLGKEVPKEFRNVKRAKEISRRLREIEKEKRELLQLELRNLGGRG